MAKVALTPTPVDLASPIFKAITRWQFEEEFVSRILADDVPQRVKYQNCAIWAYRDPDNTIVAFSTLSITDEYQVMTDGKPHMYIPLLGVHPARRGIGLGRSVIEHLVGEAACVVRANSKRLHSAVFLDVYEKSVAAIGLYTKCGFQTLAGGPFVDPFE